MQPGYPGSGQDPYGQQPPYSDPYAQPQYPPPAQQDPYAQPQQQPYADPYAQPQQQPYADPYAQPQPTSGNPYPTSGNPYPTSPAYQAPGQYPASPQYPVPGYGAPMQAGQNNVMAIIALVLGIVSIPLVCCYGIGLLPGAAGIILGILGMKKAKELGGSGKGMALAGAICGGVGAAISVVLWLLYLIGVGSLGYYGY
jgi:hypothetical protein